MSTSRNVDVFKTFPCQNLRQLGNRICLPLLLAALGASPQSAAAIACATAVQATTFPTEVVSHHHSLAISQDYLRILSRLTYRLKTTDGKNVVVRLPGENSDPFREQFAVRFVNETPGLKTPQTTLLSEQDSQVILNYIRDINGREYRYLIESWAERNTGITEKNAQISVASFYDAPTGAKTLSALNITDKIREYLTSIARSGPFGSDQASESAKRTLTQLWRGTSPERLEVLVKDLKVLLPHSIALSDGDYLAYLLKNIEDLPGSRVQNLLSLGLTRLPHSIREKLADYWIIYLILGLPDFHPDNWLLLGQDVIGIDLAHPGVDAPNPIRPLDLPLQQQPFGTYKLSAAERDGMITNISDTMRTYLMHLTKQKVLQISSESGYLLSEGELRAIMERITYAVQMTRAIEG